MIARNQVGAIKKKSTTLLNLNSLQRVTGGVLSDHALGTQTTPVHVALPRGSALPYHHSWLTGDALATLSACGTAVIARGTGLLKPDREEIGFLLSPWPCSGGSEFGISAKATIDALCCKEVGPLGAGPAKEHIAIASYNTKQQFGSVSGGSITFLVQSCSSLGVLGGKWGCLCLTQRMHSCIKTSKQFTPAKLPPK